MILRYSKGKNKPRYYKNINRMICEDLIHYEEYILELEILLQEYNGKMIFEPSETCKFEPDFIEFPDERSATLFLIRWS